MIKLKEAVSQVLFSHLPDQEINNKLDNLFGLDKKIVYKTSKIDLYTSELIHSDALNTGYKDFFEIGKALEQLNIKSMLDLGAGISRSYFIFKLFFQDIHIETIELEESRVKLAKSAAKNLALDSSNIKFGDILNADISNFDSIFLYLPMGHLIDSIIHKLSNQLIITIESHGNFISWLKVKIGNENFIKKLKSHSKRHDDSIYFLEFQKNEIPWPYSAIKEIRNSIEFQFLIEDQDVNSSSPYLYLADTFNLIEGCNTSQLDLAAPSSIIQIDSIKKIIPISQIDQRLLPIIEARRINNKIRKIIESSEFDYLIEFTDRGRLPLKQAIDLIPSYL